MFDTVLIANRGEIACRIITTLRAVGIRSVAIYSDADAGAKHVRLADEAIRIGPAPAAQSYLNISRIMDVARTSGADAVHPGYGFLAENAEFARACAAAGIVFIGPSAEALEIMGDKIRSKAHVAARGVPVVPGVSEPGLSLRELQERASEVGFPLLIKPSAGGGGKGMHAVMNAGDLPEALARARREAAASFGNGELLLERLVARPRHIEVQILADGAGRTIHLGERECSLQRRHQKVIEEAPSPLLDAGTRERIAAAAIEVARSVGYEGAGTVEFIVSAEAPDEFFFMEMNTRLQVEHPVTEMVTAIDLVHWQLLIAAGQPLTMAQADVEFDGHAIEARIYAEDPAAGFLPTGGRVLALTEPGGPGIRVDSALIPGLEVTPDYDPMLAKVIAHGPTREAALARLDRALAGTAVLGVGTNVQFLRLLLAQPAVRAGALDTGVIDRTELAFAGPDDHALITAALLQALGDDRGPRPGPSQWERRDGWRIGAPAPQRIEFEGHPVILVTDSTDAASITIGEQPPVAARLEYAGDTAHAVVASVRRAYTFAREGATIYLGRGGASWALAPSERSAAGGLGPGASNPELLSPMPGSVVAVHARTGERVDEDAPIVVIEAMKMEHVLRAPHAGVVSIAVSVGEQVRAKQVLATVTQEGSDE